MAGKRVLKRAGIALLILWLLGTIALGVVIIAQGMAAQQEAERLSVARVCGPDEDQMAGCKLDEKVTVVDLYTTSSARTPTRRWVRVQIPERNTQDLEDHDGDLYAGLFVTEHVNAELWKGSVIELDDGAGHYLIPEDSPYSFSFS